MFLISAKRFDAVLFDLDGVLTDTARIHARCWQQMFDDFLRQETDPFVPFDPVADYRAYVDGKPRYKGVASFLEAREISLPFGDPGDAPGHNTVCALGNRKNEWIHQVLREEGVDVYPGSLKLLEHLEAVGIRRAVVSSSKNCQAVLEAAGLTHYFETRVDGVVAAELGLSGKPEPDTFLEAARQMGVPPDRAVVVEDAISGVQAGRAGRFGLVLGVDRHNEAAELRSHGADVVVEDLGELLSQEG